MLRAAYFKSNESPALLNNASQIKEHLNLDAGFLWVSLESTSDDEINEILRNVFNFHPLAIEDCQSPGFQVAKIDDFTDYIFIITHALTLQLDGSEQNTRELDIFLGKNFIVTCYTDPQMPAVAKAWEHVQIDGRIARFGADFLCHTILDNIVDEYMPLLDEMELEVDWLEDAVIEKPTPQTLKRLLEIKHNIMALRRIISPQRELMNRLSRDEFPGIIDAQSLIYFRDIYDHMVRFQDLADVLRDIVSGALDIYLNSTSLRLNEIMKALTIVSTVFLPLSFFTGVFGMNFLHIPGASSQLGFYITCILLVALGILMLVYFKKRRWF